MVMKLNDRRKKIERNWIANCDGYFIMLHNGLRWVKHNTLQYDDNDGYYSSAFN